MGRPPCCDEKGLKKGPWTPEEDQKLVDYILRNGHGSWRALPKLAGLNRCGKSCRLRWNNYLRPDIKRGEFSEEDEQLIISLHSVLGNKWSQIATHLQGRTDNEIKNYWNTHLRKKLLNMGIDPITHRPRTDLNYLASLPQLLAMANAGNSMNSWDNVLRVQADAAAQLAKLQLLHNLLQVIHTTTPNMELINQLGSAPILDNHLANDYFRSNSNAQFDGLVHVPLAQQNSHFSSLGSMQVQPNMDFQAISSTCFDDQIPNANLMNNNMGNNGLSSSPESSIGNQRESKVNTSDISTHSSTSTTFDIWGEFNFDDEANDYNWKDFLDQTTTPSWPISEKHSL